MKEEYGLFVWPCSVILAEYVWQQRLQFSGVSVLEVIRFSIFFFHNWVICSFFLYIYIYI
jgi:hypothetical protein